MKINAAKLGLVETGCLGEDKMSETAQYNKESIFSFPDKWSSGLFWRWILYGYIAIYLILIVPIFVLPFFMGVENWVVFSKMALVWLLLSLFLPLLHIPHFLILAIFWWAHFNRKPQKTFTSSNAWTFLGGWTSLLVPIAAVHWPYWLAAWDELSRYEIVSERALGLVAFIIFFLFFTQFLTMLLGSLIGRVAGHYIKKYPSKNQILLVLLGSAGLAVALPLIFGPIL